MLYWLYKIDFEEKIIMVNKTKCTFTLAEVLITLVIIGIVAALTCKVLCEGEINY